jgi:hypothetical protein
MNMFLEIIKIITVLTLSYLSIILFIGGFKIMFADKTVYNWNYKLTSCLSKGIVPTKRDSDITSSIAYSMEENKIVNRSKLSHKAIDDMFS